MNGSPNTANKGRFKFSSKMRKFLEIRDQEEPFLVSSRREFSVGDVLSVAYGLRSVFAVKKDTIFALSVSDPVLQIASMIALSGLARQVVLLPASVSTEEAEVLLKFSEEVVAWTDRETLLLSENTRWQGVSFMNGDVFEGGEELTTQWIIPTSGTTGTPKLVSHSEDSILRTAKRQFEARWGQFFDPARFAGLQVFCQALVGAGILILQEPSESFRGYVKTLQDHNVSAISATPSLWRKILMANFQCPSLKYITLGGEIADKAILQALREKFPKAKITHIYASTEAGVGFAVRDGREGFPVEFCADEQNGVALRVDEEGLLWLKPPLGGEYVSETESEMSDEAGWICSGDLVRQEGDRFLFLGRQNGAINVGGNKVHPYEIQSLVCEVEGVRFARVHGKPNPFMGQVVQLFVVADKEVDEGELCRKIETRCRENLADFKVPAMILFVEEIEISAAGKSV